MKQNCLMASLFSPSRPNDVSSFSLLIFFKSSTLFSSSITAFNSFHFASSSSHNLASKYKNFTFSNSFFSLSISATNLSTLLFSCSILFSFVESSSSETFGVRVVGFPWTSNLLADEINSVAVLFPASVVSLCFPNSASQVRP